MMKEVAPGREEQAKQEIGITRISKKTAFFFSLAFIILILFIPITQTIIEITHYFLGTRNTLLPSCLTIFIDAAREVKDFFTQKDPIIKKAIRANDRFLTDIIEYEETIEENTFTRELLVPPFQYFLTGICKIGNEKAVVGKGGWLFYEPGIRYVVEPTFLAGETINRQASKANQLIKTVKPDPVQAIVQFNEFLKKRGITLVLLPAPVKPMFYADKLTSRIKDHVFLQNLSYEQFKQQVVHHGIKLLDIADEMNKTRDHFKGPLFLKTDSHWTPEIMEYAASYTAHYIRENIGFSNDFELSTVIQSETVTNIGDIARMLSLPENQSLIKKESAEIHKVLVSGTELWRPDKTAEILFLGDSFSNVFSLESMGWGESAGLAEHISHSLQMSLDCIIQNDNGSFATRQTLARELGRGRDRLNGKKAVVWQFALRELLAGDWKLIHMELAEAPETSFFVPEPGEELIITGIINNTSSIPYPGSTPYKDHIFTIHLTDVQSKDKSLENTEVLLYTYSMIDNTLTRAAHYHMGQTITVRIKSWDDVYDEFSGINRSEIDDDDLFLEDPCWGEEVIQ